MTALGHPDDQKGRRTAVSHQTSSDTSVRDQLQPIFKIGLWSANPLGDLSLDELVEQMRKAGKLWKTLLHISGGSLNLSKCSWTVRFWQWIKGRPSLMPLSANDPPLMMTNGSSPETHLIRRTRMRKR